MREILPIICRYIFESSGGARDLRSHGLEVLIWRGVSLAERLHPVLRCAGLIDRMAQIIADSRRFSRCVRARAGFKSSLPF